MRTATWTRELVARLRLPRRPARVRLTVLYSGLFLVSGVVLLAVTYLLASRPISGEFLISGSDGGPAPEPNILNAGATAAGGLSKTQSGDSHAGICDRVAGESRSNTGKPAPLVVSVKHRENGTSIEAGGTGSR